MPHEIKLDVKKAWKGYETQLARRVAECVVGADQALIEEKDTGYRWTLDRGNNWWMGLKEHDDHIEIEIAYRYGAGKVPDAMEGLKAFLKWVL